MRWTVVIPGALLPAPIAADVLAHAAAPWLTQALARAPTEDTETFDGDGAPHLAWLWRLFGGSGDPVTAPYALRALIADADCGAQCWHVDPVHFALARDHLLVTPLHDAPPTPDEETLLAEHLRTALLEQVAGAAPRLHVSRGHWFLSLGAPWALRATPLDAAIGQSAAVHWADGADGASWRRLLTEVQMRWHQARCNEDRDARGLPTVNAVWLHGGGAWTPLPARPFAAVVGDDPVLRGWALASGVPRNALHDNAGSAGGGDVLGRRDDLLAPAQFEAWGQWLERLAQLDTALRELQARCLAAGADELALVLAGRRQVRTVRLRRGDRWRLWRSRSPAQVLAEASG